MRRNPVLRLLLAALALTTLGACVHIPQRAWQNGKNVRSDQLVYGHLDIGSARAYKSTVNALSAWHESRPFTPFTKW